MKIINALILFGFLQQLPAAYGASSNAQLDVVKPPIVVTQSPMPTNQAAIFRENLALTGVGEASGSPLFYQWKFNGSNIFGATSTYYRLVADTNTVGDYSVTITNTAGATSILWKVTLTYAGSYVEPGTLPYHLATNAVGRASRFAGDSSNLLELSGWRPMFFYETNFPFLTNSTWSTNFWLKGVRGLSATSIGYSNGPAGQGAVTMISPRHFLYANHVGMAQTIAFLDTNNVVHWRRSLEGIKADPRTDTAVGILDQDLPPSVDFLPVAPANLSKFMPTNSAGIVQGIGMNASLQVFSQPMSFGNWPMVGWDSSTPVPFGLGMNWSTGLHAGDSSAPARLLIGNQLVLISHNNFGNGGPNYAAQIDLINQKMRYLSTHNKARKDYQLTTFVLTNWPSLR